MKEGKEVPVVTMLKKDALILAFGDSLTAGFGARSGSSYPDFLSQKTGFKIINAGVSGEESDEGLERLEMFLEHKPDLVILCHGGNDILRRRSMVALKNNLLKMVEMIENSGAKLILVGVPNFGLTGFSAHTLYGEVAKEKKLIYEDEVLSYIEGEDSLKSDFIHPNEKGYEMMADAFAKIIEKHFK